MKRSLLLLGICFLATASGLSAQRKEFRHFLQDNRDGGVAFHIGLSFLPLRVVSWFIPKKAFDGDAADIKWALKKVRKVRVYSLLQADIDRADIDMLKEDLYRTRKYEPLMELKREGANVELLSTGRNADRLDHLVVLVRKDDDFVMIHLRTRITIKDLNYLANRLQYDYVAKSYN